MPVGYLRPLLQIGHVISLLSPSPHLISGLGLKSALYTQECFVQTNPVLYFLICLDLVYCICRETYRLGTATYQGIL